MITKYQKFPPQQLLDTATYYYNNSLFDKALVCYSLLINTYSKDADFEQQQILIEAMNKSAHIYYFMCDYRQAYEFLIKALLLCEKTNYQSYESKIYNNIGSIYYRFNNFDVAKLYYTKALQLCKDSAVLVALYNNLGSIELEHERIDTSFYYLKKALQICKRHTDIYSHELLRNMALCYQKIMRYDSAYYYHHLSLEELKKIKISGKECEAENLSNLGQMFFALNKTDSALFYIGLSNKIAQENHFLRILSDNYLAISKNEEKKGNIKNSFEHYKIYAGLKDSIFNNDIFGDINQLQRIYEVS
jgi:tetratricopeptide (TPR) repeat protein